MRSPSRTLFALAFAIVFAPACFAQFPPISSTTSTPVPGAGHDYLGGIAETVNPANGAVSIRIPVIMPPGRGITLPFSFAYDSNGVNYLISINGGALRWQEVTTPSTGAGWSDSVPTVSDRLVSWTTTNPPIAQGTSPLITSIHCYAMVDFVFQDAQGNRHNLGLTNYSFVGGTGPCMINENDWPYYFDAEQVTQGGEGPIAAAISSSWNSFPPVTVADGDGTTYVFNGGGSTTFPASITDRNGNYMTISSTYPAFSYVDTLGRTVLQDSGFAVSPETVTIAGLGAPYTLTWTTLSTPSFTTPFTTVSGSCSAPGHVGWSSPGNHAVSSLTLPNGKSFTFTYDATYGLVNKMTYPTGGYVRYVWGMNVQGEEGFSLNPNCTMLYGVPAVIDRYVSFDGTHEVQHQHFSYTTNWGPGTTKQTTVTTYDLVRNTSSQAAYTYSMLPADTIPNSIAPTSQNPVESSIAYYNDLGTTLLKTVSKTWQNVRLLKSQQTTFPSGLGSKTAWGYNASELQTEQDDYDFGNPAPGTFLRATVTNYATSTAMAAAHVIDKPSSVIVYSDANKTNRVAETDYAYDNPVGTTTSGIVHHSGSCNCGNLTSQSQWLNVGGSNPTTNFTNDDTGQRLSMTDPRGNQTTYSYTDSYSSGMPPGPTNAYLTTVTYPQTGGVNHIEHFAYAYASGEVTSSADQNNQVTTYKYVDNLARLTETDYPDGGVTSLAYNDSAYNPATPSPSVTTTKKINAATNLVAVSAMDGLGQAVRSELTSDPSGTTYTDITRDGLGRVWKQSNPYRTTGDSTYGITTNYFDALGRTCLIVPPDGTLPSGGACPATQPSNTIFTTYSANTATVTDQAGKSRKSVTDGLGRIVQVFEDPSGLSYETDYAYDVLDNLICAAQKGTNTGTFSSCASTPATWRPRAFVYDSLSRLTSSTNPESGTITYKYDSDTNCASPNSFTGLLVSKTDARGIRTCMQYDALNRLTQKAYSDGTTPTASFLYDVASTNGVSISNPVGRLVRSLTSGPLTQTINSYDAMGRITTQWINTPNYTGPASFIPTYSYNLAGGLTSYTNGMGVTFSQSFDGAGRVTQVTSSWADSQHPGTLFTADSSIGYFPHGALRKAALGNGLTVTNVYNNRLQPCLLEVNNANVTLQTCNDSTPGGNILDFWMGYNAGSSNNGNLMNWNATGTQSFIRTYSYDSLNRIATMADSNTGQACRGLSWTIDAWGNRTDQSVTAGTCGTFHQTVDTNNRLLGAPYQYDGGGNLTNDGSHTYVYDAENRLVSVDGGATATYIYDAAGARAEKITGGAKTDFVRDLSGNVVAEYGPGCGSFCWTVGYVYLGGSQVAQYQNGTTYFIHTDHLGSARLLTAMNQSVYDSLDYLPFGEQIAGDTGTTHKFTSKERDTESGLDNFGTRFDSSSLGRFMSPDVAAPEDDASAQGLNLYSYVQNNPTNATDPDGHDCVFVQGNTAYVARGDCTGISNGTYVPGTVDEKSGSYNRNTGTLSFSYTPYWTPPWEPPKLSFFVIGNVYPTHPGQTEFEKFASRVAAGADNMNAIARQVLLQAGASVFGRAIGLGIEWTLAARAAKAAEAAADLVNLDKKIVTDMLARGWTRQGITDTIQQAEEAGTTYTVPNYRGGTATEYVSPSTGKFVVVDDATKRVIQVSGPGYRPNYLVK